MITHTTPHYSIYFGSAHDNLYLNDQTRKIISNNVFELPRFQYIKQLLNISHLVFLHQTHSIDGLIITNHSSLLKENIPIKGDYIITNLSHVGIGIFTADCLPLVIYDKINHTTAIVHAGWKGAVAGIVPEVINQLRKNFNTSINDLTFFFGPSAHVCCYEVKHDFIKQIAQYSFFEQTLQTVNNTLFFNLPLFVQLQLKELGTNQDTCIMTYSTCTICSPDYFSYRRQSHAAGRQASIITLS